MKKIYKTSFCSLFLLLNPFLSYAKSEHIIFGLKNAAQASNHYNVGVIQLESFKIRQNAINYQKRLQALTNAPVHLLQIKQFYVVNVGPFNDAATEQRVAAQLLNDLKSKSHGKTFTPIAPPQREQAVKPVPEHAYKYDFKYAQKYGHATLQLGGYWSYQGAKQFINIEDLVGDEFTITHHADNSGLVGVGYFIDGQERERFKMVYGINAFYLAKTSVRGEVTQENLFTNLYYRYNVTHFPVYAVAKSIIKTKFPQYALTLDVGIGPNFLRASNFEESPRGSNTLPDDIFTSHTSTVFTATAGLGIRFNHLFGDVPFDCAYRFFYLGQGSFNKQTNQVTTLNTGSDFANALICGVTI